MLNTFSASDNNRILKFEQTGLEYAWCRNKQECTELTARQNISLAC